MENASRALIIAGSVLISLLVIAALVFMFNQVSDLRQAQEDASMEDKLQSFYVNLDTYIDGNKRGSDILSLANLIDDFNERRAGQNEYKYGNEGYDQITLRVHYEVSTVDWKTTVFFKGRKDTDGWFNSAKELTKAKQDIDNAVDKKGREKIEGVDNYTVQQLASMRYQELMVLTTKENGEVDYELLDTIQKVAEEYNILVAEQKDVKNTVIFGEPTVTYDDVTGRIIKLEYEQK